MSLFAERKLIELRLPSGKPGAEGSRALCEYLDIASGDDVLLMVAGKIDKQSTNSKWYKALDKAGATDPGVAGGCQQPAPLVATAGAQRGHEHRQRCTAIAV